MPIHPTAIVDPKANIGKGVEVGPFAIIGPNTQIGDGCIISAYAMVDWTVMGANSKIGAKTIIGGDPQIYNWPSVSTWVRIGEGVFVNELSAIHRSMHEGKSTIIGDGCYIMTQTHIGHDCELGREVTVTTLAGLSGHVQVDDFAVIGGAVGIHQFVKIGSMSMVGGMSRIVQDVVPYFTVTGNPSVAHGLNSYALKKRGVSVKDRKEIKAAYKILVREGLSIKGALDKLKSIDLSGEAVASIINFIENSERGITI